MDFKYLVIGCGIMGSAAAMHLAASADGVALLGPDADMADRDESIPKGSHHDVGRITRLLDPDPFWGSIARRSIERYRELERITGIEFFNECGLLWLDTNPQQVEELELLASDDAEKIKRVDNTFTKERFSYLASEWIVTALYQAHKAGTINPLGYVQSMAAKAKAAGADRIYDHAVRLEISPTGVTVHTAADRKISTEKVLFATGAYAAGDGLLGRKLPLRACKNGVVLVEVAHKAVWEDLAEMPSIISRPPPNRPNTYLLPPLMYPDGKYYLKIGTSGPGPPINDTDELNRWLRFGKDDGSTAKILAELPLIFPHLDLSKWRYLPCVTCHTPDTYPIIDVICGGRVGLLLGGNGYAGKSGDALGELGAALLSGAAWPGAVPRTELSLARFF